VKTPAASGMVNVTFEWCTSANAAAFLDEDQGRVQKWLGQP
jgi:hypothetical protein